MKYAVLLRGINVGGKNKVGMSELRELVANLGYEQVETYINSGNLFFESQQDAKEIESHLSQLFAAHYPFVNSFTIFSQQEYLDELASLPAWWQEDLARKDVLFYTNQAGKDSVDGAIQAMSLTNEVVHFGQLGVYWGKYDEKDYLKTAYHKQLIKQECYKYITIRNGKTFVKLADFLKKK